MSSCPGKKLGREWIETVKYSTATYVANAPTMTNRITHIHFMIDTLLNPTRRCSLYVGMANGDDTPRQDP